LVLFQTRRALVFTDPRLFGAVRFHVGPDAPAWWSDLPPALLSASFTAGFVEKFFQCHRKLPIKATLLLQDGFPGIGNWMADEILWQARLNPKLPGERVVGQTSRRVWKVARTICKRALETIAADEPRADFGDPPKDWLFHQRWSRKGHCPIHKSPLTRETIAGRTTVWCSLCQPLAA
jgi:formamidopyrimidine-DNA glycosylase